MCKACGQSKCTCTKEDIKAFSNVIAKIGFSGNRSLDESFKIYNIKKKMDLFANIKENTILR